MPFPGNSATQKVPSVAKDLLSILLVDDDNDFLYIARHYLENSGEFRVDTTSSAQDALDYSDY